MILRTATCLLAGLLCVPAVGDDAVDFARDVFPMFQQHCQDCHGADDDEGQLRLDARASFFAGGVSGSLVDKARPELSLLLRRVVSDEDGDRMPLDGEPLSETQIDLLRRWIASGAAWPEGVGEQVAEAKTHWAYIAPQRPVPPAVRHVAQVANPIDAFIVHRLEQAGGRPSAPAPPGRLLRRVSLDLTGLPPTPEELAAFLTDDSPNAYEKAVDRLLASPRYGERWAQPWLDLARYADSNGYQADQFRSVWPFRDWVINAINADKPFDEFTVEQIAGDLLPNARTDQRIATGFHRCTTCNVEAGVDPEENRVNQVVDRVNTTGTVWLGTTLECAQCHSHKYDPISQDEYYQVLAFFNNTELEVKQPNGTGVQFEVNPPNLTLPYTVAQELQRAELNAAIADVAKAIAQRRELLDDRLAEDLQQWRSIAAQTTGWETLPLIEFHSTGGASHRRLDDGSVLVEGSKPATDTYTVTLSATLPEIRSLRLEAMTHESLPGNGPGRGDAARPNFVLYAFDVVAANGGDGDATAVSFRDATADFSQQNWDVHGLIDSDPKTGWAINPQFGKPHTAVFELSEPLVCSDGCRLTIALPQHYGGARTLGRFRISAAAVTGAALEATLPPAVTEAIAKDPADWTKAERKVIADYQATNDAESVKLVKQRERLEKDLASIRPPASMVLEEQDEPRMTAVMKRGDFLSPGRQVSPGVPRVLHDLPAEENLTRLDFANWLVSTENPLVARVTVNRWWLAFFGRGLVTTPEDFGTQGDKPTHPELLDWLAVEFMDGGWSMKHIHRLIVTSATYRQDSRLTDEQLGSDPLNALYGRGPRHRLPAESLRDNALAIAGVISGKIGGPPVYPPQPENIWRHVGRNGPKYVIDTDENRFRRGLYTIWRRSAPYPAFVTFDAPDRASCVVARSRTNTPLQALTLLNDEAYVELAWKFAERVINEADGNTVDARLDFAFQAALSREPADAERKFLRELLHDYEERWRSDPDGLKQLIAGRSTLADLRVDPAEMAAWFAVSNILLNLDETISKN